MRSSVALLAVFLAVVSLPGCRTHPGADLPDGAVCRSLDGRPLFPPEIPDAARARMEQQLSAARDELARSPGDRDAAIWVGRRLGYLGLYREAVGVYTAALQRHPDDPYLLRHRGHRNISLRRLDAAIDDLSRAAARCRTEADTTEPDGIPTPGRPPHSSLHFNVHYHLGLALFLAGEFAAAERAWLDCLAVCDDDESRVAVCHWLWTVRVRLGDPAGADAVAGTIRRDMDVVENTSYHRLCLLYAGGVERSELEAGEGSSGAALAFGLAHHEWVRGDRRRGEQELRALATAPGWAAFGVIAAEAEAARQGWALR